jgi:hypothetical protein
VLLWGNTDPGSFVTHLLTLKKLQPALLNRQTLNWASERRGTKGGKCVFRVRESLQKAKGVTRSLTVFTEGKEGEESGPG